MSPQSTPEEQRLERERLEQEGLQERRTPAYCFQCARGEMHSHDWREQRLQPVTAPPPTR